MSIEVSEQNNLAKKKQKIILIGTGLGIILLGWIFVIVTNDSSKKDLSKIISDSKNKIVLQDPNSGVKAEDKWLFKAEKKLDSYDEYMKENGQKESALEERLNQIEQNYQSTVSSQEQLIQTQSSKIEELKSQVGEIKNKNHINDPAGGVGGLSPNQMIPRSIQSLDIDLENSSVTARKDGHFKISEYVPSGSYAPATIISGVDASVGITAQSDPRAVLLRVDGAAVSSIYDGNAQKVDLSGCIITGAASGDLSSEKVYIKLVGMTCGKDQETVMEKQVKGYVAGQGKSGVRGHVVSREGDLLAKSFIAGLISGFGQGLSEKVAPPLAFSNGLTTQQALSTGDVAKKGLGKGVSSAAERTANYLITRAEQYQPVISIPSGISVEVVFLEGFYLDSTNKEKEPVKPNNNLTQN